MFMKNRIQKYKSKLSFTSNYLEQCIIEGSKRIGWSEKWHKPGAAPGVTVIWDPWADGVEPCCYVVFVRMYDRAVVDNMASGAHHVENWRSITVA